MDADTSGAIARIRRELDTLRRRVAALEAVPAPVEPEPEPAPEEVPEEASVEEVAP